MPEWKNFRQMPELRYSIWWKTKQTKQRHTEVLLFAFLASLYSAHVHARLDTYTPPLHLSVLRPLQLLHTQCPRWPDLYSHTYYRWQFLKLRYSHYQHMLKQPVIVHCSSTTTTRRILSGLNNVTTWSCDHRLEAHCLEIIIHKG